MRVQGQSKTVSTAPGSDTEIKTLPTEAEKEDISVSIWMQWTTVGKVGKAFEWKSSEKILTHIKTH